MTVNEAKTPDAELVRRTLTGERDAYGILMIRYQRQLHALIRGIVRAPEDADDLVQETFFRAYRYLDRFDAERAFRPWLLKIGVNLCYQHLRRTRQEAWVSLDEEHPETGRTRLERLETPGGVAAVTRPLETARLSAAIDRLPPLHRTILLLRAVQGLRYEEIAETLGVPEGTVMSRLSRARRALQELLAGVSSEPAGRKGARG